MLLHREHLTHPRRNHQKVQEPAQAVELPVVELPVVALVVAAGHEAVVHQAVARAVVEAEVAAAQAVVAVAQEEAVTARVVAAATEAAAVVPVEEIAAVAQQEAAPQPAVPVVGTGAVNPEDQGPAVTNRDVQLRLQSLLHRTKDTKLSKDVAPDKPLRESTALV